MNKIRNLWRLSLTLALSLCFTTLLFAQKTVSGKVTTKEEPNGAPSITVLVKGTTTGTITDIEGNYKIAVPDDKAILVFSFVGYKSQEIAVGNQSTINVALEEDNQQLQEIVVVGYGVQKKTDLTGSVTRLGEKDLNAGTFTSPLQRMSGRAAGVTINQAGGEPGVAPNVRIRGIAGITGASDPLVVVDGIQGGMDLLNQVPPTEIESFDILKDASATAIYGARGAAGVILVTTKKAKQGKTTLEYSAVGSYETISKRYEMLTADEWRALATQRGLDLKATDFGGNTDWQKQVTRDGYTQNHNLSIGGGTSGFNYRATLTAIDQQGIIIGSGYTNYIGRLQISQKALNDKLTLTYNANVGSEDRRFNNADVIGTALGRRPTDPIYRTDGTYFIDNEIFGYVNPYARAKEMVDGQTLLNMFGSARADYQITKDLTASVFGSWRKTDLEYGQFKSVKTTLGDARDNKGIATRETKQSDEQLFNAILSYKKNFGDHNLDFTLVYEWQKAVYQGFKAIGRNFINEATALDALQSGNIRDVQSGDISSYKNDQTLLSYLGRVNYSYKGKYLATVNFRRDASSKFGENNRWANFPSVSLGWHISEEDFLKKQNILSDLKLRAGFGITGSQQALGALNSVRLVGVTGTAFFGGGIIPTFGIKQNANPDLRWETRQMFNVGLDFAFLNNKLTGTIDYYNGVTSDLLFKYRVPLPPFPYNELFANVGKMRNSGVEVTLNYVAIDKGDFRLTLGGNFTHNANTIEELSGFIGSVPLNTDYVRWGGGGTVGVASTNDAIQYLIKGQSIGTFYVFKHAGVDAEGNQLLDDINGDGVVESGDASKDRYIAGNALPIFTYGFTPTASYKNWDFGMVLRGVYGNDIYNVRRAQLSALSQLGQGNVIKGAAETGIRNISNASDYWIEKGSYARLENLSIGYRFKTENWKLIESLRVSFVANNLFVITNYSGIDPETNINGQGNDGRGFGTDFGLYPRTRSFAVGLNVAFK